MSQFKVLRTGDAHGAHSKPSPVRQAERGFAGSPGVGATPWGVAAVAAIGVGGSVAGGIMGSDAAKKSADTLAAASNQASVTEQNYAQGGQANLQPYVTGGANAFTNLQQLLGIGSQGGPSSPILQMLGIGAPGGAGSINPATFQGSPGYQYQVQQGQNQVTNSAAANGGLGGNALRALQANGQGLANQNWNQYLGNASNAWQQQIGNVSSVANTGFDATKALASLNQNLGSQIGGNQIGAGNALAAGDIASAKQYQDMIKGIVSSLSQAAGGMSGGGMGATGGGGGGGFVDAGSF